ncbi:MAG: HlyD family efflux transporter periplasmic adaptor subunit [Lachnospiraceae bacterium]|nr:HlyD family efflux transporter periplasmic adaptor subunit [Lachnospiraceae bacterium]
MAKLSKKKRNRIFIVLLALILVVAACYTALIQPYLERDELVYEETEIYQDTLTVRVSESGSLGYGLHEIAYDVDVQVSDAEEEEDEEEDEEELVQRYLEIEEIHVAAGQQVEAGQELLTLSSESVESVRKLLQTALASAKSDYADAEDEYNLAVIDVEITNEITENAGKYAETIYTKGKQSIINEITSMELEITDRIGNREALNEAMAEAQEDYGEAKKTYDEVKASYEAYYSPDNAANFMVGLQEFLNAQSTYERALSAVESAQKSIDDNESAIESLQTAVKAAKAVKNIALLENEQTYVEDTMNSENADLVYQATLESLESDLQEAEEEKLLMEEKLAAFEELVGEDGVLRAPESGMITSVSYEEGDTLEKVGTLFYYTTAEDMTISVDVTQEDIVALEVGDDVEIIFNAYEDQIFTGQIASIDTTATSAETPTVSYSVVVDVDGNLDQLYGGMTAKINFVVANSENTLYISRKALVSENGKYYVYKKSGLAGKELAEVEIGLKNESYVEILSGLSPEDTIYVATSVSGAN